MKIDVFNHVFPTEFFDKAETLLPRAAVQRWKAMPELYDMDARMKVLERFDDYQQIISMSQPPCGFPKKRSTWMARLAGHDGERERGSRGPGRP